jgi:hypothetical protein
MGLHKKMSYKICVVTISYRYNSGINNILRLFPMAFVIENSLFLCSGKPGGAGGSRAFLLSTELINSSEREKRSPDAELVAFADRAVGKL